MATEEDRFGVIREQIRAFPTGPGLYFMKGPKDKALYISKAKTCVRGWAAANNAGLIYLRICGM